MLCLIVAGRSHATTSIARGGPGGAAQEGRWSRSTGAVALHYTLARSCAMADTANSSGSGQARSPASAIATMHAMSDWSA